MADLHRTHLVMISLSKMIHVLAISLFCTGIEEMKKFNELVLMLIDGAIGMHFWRRVVMSDARITHRRFCTIFFYLNQSSI